MGDKILPGSAGVSPAIPQWLHDEAAAYDLPLARAPRTILDIGANVGAFALRAAKLWPEAHIFCFEPVPETADQLRQNVKGLNVVMQDMAIRSFTGTDLILLGDHPAVNSFHQLGRQNDHNRKVVSCLDAKLLPSAEFVKIDTEGCELEIIERLDLTETVALCCEYHRPADIAPIKGICEKAGLELVEEKATWATGGHLKFARPGSLSETRNTKHETRKLFVAMPYYHGFDAIFVQSLCAVTFNPPCRMQLSWCGEAGIMRSRNRLSAQFLKSDCTHILFIDSDIGFTRQDIERMVAHNEPVVGGMYPLKRFQKHVEWCGNGLLRESPVRADGLQQVRYIGTGFICIAREVFQQMIAEDGAEITYTEDEPPHDTVYDFWRLGVRKTDDPRTRWLSEDWFFCQRCLELGIDVFADTHVVLRHAGPAIWPLPFQDLSPEQSEAQPTDGSVHRPALSQSALDDSQAAPGTAAVPAAETRPSPLITA